jgi:hypothetical protein
VKKGENDGDVIMLNISDVRISFNNCLVLLVINYH